MGQERLIAVIDRTDLLQDVYVAQEQRLSRNLFEKSFLSVEYVCRLLPHEFLSVT